ncbi:MAG: NDP-sugar synthase [Candidatus Thermoplasmatota archaeon]
MKAVILAGGEGKRLRPLTEKRPKPLVPIAGRACIEYVISSLVKSGIKEIIITTSYMSDKLIKAIGNGESYGAGILYSFEDKPCGTAGAVKRVEKFLDGTFIVASGDVVMDMDFQKLYEKHKKNNSIATLALTYLSDPRKYGVVEIDRRNRIKRFLEKPKEEEVFSNLINAGIYVLETDVLSYIPKRGMYDFSKNLFPYFLEKKIPFYGFKMKGLWKDIGALEDLLEANAIVLKNKRIIEKSAKIQRSVKIKSSYIGKATKILKNSEIITSSISNGVEIDMGVKVSSSLILDGTKIGWKSNIEKSIIGENCKIEGDAYIKDCIIGDDVSIKMHAKLIGTKILSSV